MAMISIPSIVYSQSLEPPLSIDEFSWLRWGVVIMTGVISSMTIAFYAFIKTSYDARISDKDTQILDMKNEITRLIVSNDSLERDIRDKILPALITSTEIMREYIKTTIRPK